MKISNVLKRASICLGLLLVTTIVTSNYQYSIAKIAKSEKSEKNQKAIDKVKEGYKTLIKFANKDSIQKQDAEDFYNNNFDKPYIEGLFRLRKKGKKLDEDTKNKFHGLVISYLTNLFSSEAIKQLKNCKDEIPNDTFKTINKKSFTSVQCKLQKKDSQDKIDMSVSVTKKTNSIRDIYIMKSIQVIKGAKNQLENYLDTNKKQDKKSKNKLKSMKIEEILEACKKAWSIKD